MKAGCRQGVSQMSAGGSRLLLSVWLSTRTFETPAGLERESGQVWEDPGVCECWGG